MGLPLIWSFLNFWANKGKKMLKKTYTYTNGKYQEMNSIKESTTFSYRQNEEKIYPAIKEINDILEKTFLNRNIVVLEKVSGRFFKIYYNGLDFRIGSECGLLKFDEKYYEINKIFNKNKSCFINLAKELFHVPFTLFGEIVSKKTENEVCYLSSGKTEKIVFYDIFLNDNWMNWEDAKSVLIKSELSFTPELYIGKFNLQKIKSYANGFSEFSSFANQLIAGIIVRPILEDEYKGDNLIDSRLIAKITAKKFIKKIKLLPSVFNKQSPANVAYKLILDYTNDDQTEPYWKSILIKENILPIKPNLDKIIKIITKDTLEMLFEEITLRSINSGIREKIIVDCIEKQIPWKIRNILKLDL